MLGFHTLSYQGLESIASRTPSVLWRTSNILRIPKIPAKNVPIMSQYCHHGICIIQAVQELKEEIERKEHEK